MKLNIFLKSLRVIIFWGMSYLLVSLAHISRVFWPFIRKYIYFSQLTNISIICLFTFLSQSILVCGMRNRSNFIFCQMAIQLPQNNLLKGPSRRTCVAQSVKHQILDLGSGHAWSQRCEIKPLVKPLVKPESSSMHSMFRFSLSLSLSFSNPL